MKMENRELTLTEFREMWYNAKKINGADPNVIHETTGTIIVADDYDIVHDEFGDIIVTLYREGGFIAEVKLKYIRNIH